jgi:hypothetical protein
MEILSDLTLWLSERGTSLSEFNPGSNEVMLNFDDAIRAVHLCLADDRAVLGGDILDITCSPPRYSGGSWFCNFSPDEEWQTICARCSKEAVDYLQGYPSKAKAYHRVVLVFGAANEVLSQRSKRFSDKEGQP